MHYLIDLENNRGFVQILGLTSTLTPAETPLAFQVRGGASLLERLASALAEAHERILAIDAAFHDDPAAREAFEAGFVVFRAGDVPVTCVVQRRAVSLMLGARQVGVGAVALDALRDAVSRAQAAAN